MSVPFDRLNDALGHTNPPAQARMLEGTVSQVFDDGTVMVSTDEDPTYAYGPMNTPGYFPATVGARALIAVGGPLQEVWMVNWHA